MKKYLIILFMLLTFCGSTFAEVTIVKNGLNSILTPTDPKYANATCFIYPSGDFKCACRFSDNSKLWASKEMSKIQGLTSTTRYGKIKGCERQ